MQKWKTKLQIFFLFSSNNCKRNARNQCILATRTAYAKSELQCVDFVVGKTKEKKGKRKAHAACQARKTSRLFRFDFAFRLSLFSCWCCSYCGCRQNCFYSPEIRGQTVCKSAWTRLANALYREGSMVN